MWLTGLFANKPAPGSANFTYLIQAASIKNIPIICGLIDHGADLEAVYTNGWTALRMALERGEGRYVCALLLRGANSNSRDLRGESIMESAKERGMQWFLAYCENTENS
jgi:ankyrin repeat protein